MNSTHFLAPSAPLSSTPGRTRASTPAGALSTLESRVALRLASRLTEGAEALPADITERLRFARERALLRARTGPAAAARAAAAGGASRSRGAWAAGWRLRFAGLLPLVILAGGLLLIQLWQDSSQISAAAEIDAALLSDDLPPTAYSDAGFVEYLKTPNE